MNTEAIPPVRRAPLSYCEEPGCGVDLSKEAGSCEFRCGSYCSRHIQVAQKRELLKEFNKWKLGEQPHQFFKGALSIVSQSEQWLVDGDDQFSKSSICYGFDVEKPKMAASSRSCVQAECGCGFGTTNPSNRVGRQIFLIRRCGFIC